MGSNLSVAKNTTPTLINRNSDRQLRLRLSWGGGTPQTWTGKITAVNGAFSNVAPLGLGPDANAAAMRVGEDLDIRHWSPTSYGGADVTLAGTADTQVRFDLSSVEQPESRFERTIMFDELVAGSVNGELDLLGNAKL